MKEISNIIYKLIFLFFILVSFQAKGSILSVGQPDAKVTVKVFSSLTCPHCANFHTKIFYKLEKDFINEGKVRFEHHAFPLDLAALNAEIVVRCHVDNITKIKLLGKMYEKQKIWAVGSDINKINESIKRIGSQFNLDDVKMDECLKSERAQDNVLNQRIEAQKKYKIDSTPTILINEKKYDGKIDYKQFKKAIEKNL